MEHKILLALWADQNPWRTGPVAGIYPGLIQRAIEGIDELARASGDDSIPSLESRSAPMTLTQLMKHLRFGGDHRAFKKWASRYGLRREGNRQRWSIRLDQLPKNHAERLA